MKFIVDLCLAQMANASVAGRRIQDTGYKIQDAGYRIQDAGYRMQD